MLLLNHVGAAAAAAAPAAPAAAAVATAQDIALSDNRQHLDELPARAREALLSVVAAYSPYYNPPHVRSTSLLPWPFVGCQLVGLAAVLWGLYVAVNANVLAPAEV